MTWTDMTEDWAIWFRRMQTRFPHLDDSAMPYSKQGRERFESYLAETHNLSLNEAHEEVNDFLYIETLTREADGTPEAA